MKQLLLSLERYGVGTRAFHEDEILRICEDQKITILTTPEQFAFSFSLLGRSFIVIPKRHRGVKRLFSLLHEWAHIALHSGDEPMALWHGLSDTKREAEADAVALVAMIPRHMIFELAGEYGQSRYGDKIWRERCRLFFLYGV